MRTLFSSQLSTYAAYHRDPRNRATHFVGVPSITFAVLAAGSFVSLATIGPLPVTLATVLAVSVMIYWMLLDPPLGALASLLHVPLIWLAHRTVEQGVAAGWTVIAITFVGGWAFQLVGHAIEGRRPALVDNLLQVFIAPLFLVTEAVRALGLRREIREQTRP